MSDQDPLRKPSPTDWDVLQPMAPALVHFAAMVQGIQEATRGLTRGLQTAVAAIPTLPAFDFKAFLEPIQAISATVQALPDRARTAATKAAVRGWFIGPRLPLSALKDLEDLVDGDAIDALFVEHYRESWTEVEQIAFERLPARNHLLMEAFTAHREGRYVLSIPVFLAQADGLCDDALKGKGHLFATKGARVQERIQLLEKLLAQEDSRFLEAIIEPLKASLPFSAPLHQWETSRNTFNRNAILHGRDNEYATELNSLRCISLIDSLSWTLYDRGPGEEPINRTTTDIPPPPKRSDTDLGDAPLR